MYFNAKSNGPLKDITFEELDVLSHTVYRRYMCNDAFEDAQGHYPRDPVTHGPQIVAEDVPSLVPILTDPGEEEGQILSIEYGWPDVLTYLKILSRKQKLNLPLLQRKQRRPRNVRVHGRRRLRLQNQSIPSGTTNLLRQQLILFG
jgi:hypothetical protein